MLEDRNITSFVVDWVLKICCCHVGY